MGVMSFLLRVTLPDLPGSLGSLAIALGSVGADILSLDVLERGDGYAMDDIVVHVPQGTMPDAIITAVEQIDGVLVESLQPYGGVLEANRELELIDAVAAAGKDRLQLLARDVPAALRVGWALVTSNGGGSAEVVASAESAPVEPQEVPVDLVDIRSATSLDASRAPETWQALDTSLAAAPLNNSHTLVVARPGGPDFRPSEIARLGHFAGILRNIRGL